MSFSDTDVKALYNGNGVTTNFAIPFTIFDNDSTETKVYIRDEADTDNITETLQVEGALQDYTLTGASPPGTPFDTTVVFNSAPASTKKVLIKRVTARTQTLDMNDSQATPLTSIELQFDRVVGLIQELAEQLTRTPKFMISTDEDEPALAEPVEGNLIGWESGDLVNFTADDIVTMLDGDELTTVHTDTIANNTGPSSITDMTIAQASYRSIWIEYTMERKTATQGVRASGTLILEYERYNGSYRVTDVNLTEGHGVLWTISSGGQVSYTSDNMSGGSYSGTLKWKLKRRFDAET